MGTWAGRPRRRSQIPAGLPIMAVFWSDDWWNAHPSPKLST